MNMYFDESGYTGANYCDKSQPYFVLACNWFDTPSLNKIEKFLYHAKSDKSKNGEIKFSNICRNKEKKKTFVKNFLKFLNEGEIPFNYILYFVDKETVLIRKFIDDCIEPILFKLKIDDLTQESRSRCCANMLHSSLSGIDKKWYLDFLSKYNKLIKDATNKSDYCESFEKLYQHCTKIPNNTLCVYNSETVLW